MCYAAPRWTRRHKRPGLSHQFHIRHRRASKDSTSNASIYTQEIPRVCRLIKPASASVKRPTQKHYKRKNSSLGKVPSCRTAEHVTTSLGTAILERFASVARCQRKHVKMTPRRSSSFFVSRCVFQEKNQASSWSKADRDVVCHEFVARMKHTGAKSV